ncbi:MAG: asparagine synthase (glutamine-hydrolyzing) [Burkholderiales bacterium]
MCGIAAIFDPRHSPSNAASIRAMMDTVRYRGPDDEGYACFADANATATSFAGADTPPHCVTASYPGGPVRIIEDGIGDHGGAFLWLGHRRLAIVDVSAGGHQPMCSRDECTWIVYNGEIYNYLELREELQRLGHEFTSQSDTEVILAAYGQWGTECLAHFNGMFAFVLYDRTRRRLFAARDRFAVKPLYYWAAPDGRIAFASEIKQFTVLPGWSPCLNGQRAYDFLNWGITDHTAETLFAGVFQLKCGEALEISLDAQNSSPVVAPGERLPTYSWYTLRSVKFAGEYAEAVREMRELFTDSVRLRLRADVPVGSCLSGGLDSSSIVCTMNSLLREKNAPTLQKTFSACAEVKRFDEREFIDEVVGTTDVQAHYVYPPLGELFDTLDSITWHQDEPFGSTSIYAQWHVFKLAAANHVKVMLDGQGADEQLAGYHNYFGTWFAQLFRQLHWLTLAREILATRRMHGYSVMWAIKQAANNWLPEWLRQPLRRWVGKSSAHSRLLNLNALKARPLDPFANAGWAHAKTVNEQSRAQLVATTLQMLLHWEDRDSMAHSVEARVPFLDFRLVEYILGLPDDYRISGGVTKRLLRDAMRGVLPERVRLRMDKLGFVTPEEVWLREGSPDEFRCALRMAIQDSRGVIEPSAEITLEDMIAGKIPFSFQIWRFISFGAWMRIFKVQVQV